MELVCYRELATLRCFVDGRANIRKMSLCLMELENTDGATIRETITEELKQRDTDLQYLVACAFDGTVNFSGDITVLGGHFSEMSRRDMPYIHCRTHVVS
jgi:hypothetical protein